jgi:hypothetical protein
VEPCIYYPIRLSGVVLNKCRGQLLERDWVCTVDSEHFYMANNKEIKYKLISGFVQFDICSMICLRINTIASATNGNLV